MNWSVYILKAFEDQIFIYFYEWSDFLPGFRRVKAILFAINYNPAYMNKFLTAIILLFMFLSVKGQNISGHEADSLRRSLNKSEGRVDRINSLLKLAEYQIFKPGEFKADLDSAAEFISQAERLNINGKSANINGRIFLVKAYLAKEKGQEKAGKGLVEQAIGLLGSTKDKFHLGKAFLHQAQYYDYNDGKQLMVMIQLTEQAVELFKQSGYLQEEAYSLQKLAELHNINLENSKALKELERCLQIYRSIHYTQIQGIYDLLGRVYYDLRDFKNALNNELMALQTAESVHDISMQTCEINNDIALIFLELESREKAVNYFKNALAIAENHKDQRNIVLITTNLVDTYVRLNKPSDALQVLNKVPARYTDYNHTPFGYEINCCYLMIYIQLKKYKQAQPYCDKLLEIVKRPGLGDLDRSNIYVMLIRYYKASKQYPLALSYLKENNFLTQKIGDPIRISRNFSSWFSLDTAQRNYKSAVTNLLKFHKINDSLFNEKKSKQILQLQVQYETQKKVNDLKIKDQRIALLDQNYKLGQIKLNQSRTEKNIVIVGIVVMFAFIGLLYRQYRNKKRVNQVTIRNSEVITTQNVLINQKNKHLELLLQEKEWLIKEVHHRVKNNLQTIISLLQSQAAYLENDALEAIQTSQNRIYTMSLIHQKLYRSEDIQTINMASYIPELIKHLKDSFDSSRKIEFNTKIDEVDLDASVAIPVALIINEALTNSIKYAFPRDREGEITVSLCDDGDLLRLELSDNGIGMDKDSIKENPVSLGLQLIMGLTKEIRGEVSIKGNDGVKISIIFKKQAIEYANVLHGGSKSLS